MLHNPALCSICSQLQALLDGIAKLTGESTKRGDIKMAMDILRSETGMPIHVVAEHLGLGAAHGKRLTL